MHNTKTFDKEWREIYLTPRNEVGERDLHQEFANACGISRQEAKKLCYKNMYRPSVPWILSIALEAGMDAYKSK